MKHLIVESKNDKLFFQGLLQYMAQQQNIAIDIAEILASLEYTNADGKAVRGLSMDSLVRTLRELTPIKVPNTKIGILLDADKTGIGQTGMLGGIENRLKSVNTAVETVFGLNPNFTKMCCSKTDFKTIAIETDTFETIDIEIGCYFVNINGEGELETLMRKLHKQPAHAADCLAAWRKCYTEKLPEIASKYHIKNIENLEDKELGKFWNEFYKTYDAFLEKELDRWFLQFYHKFDTVEHKNRGKSDQNTDFEFIFIGKENNGKQIVPRGSEIYDFESKLPEFQALCGFLQSFL
jgi:hypothetical protein